MPAPATAREKKVPSQQAAQSKTLSSLGCDSHDPGSYRRCLHISYRHHAQCSLLEPFRRAAGLPGSYLPLTSPSPTAADSRTSLAYRTTAGLVCIPANDTARAMLCDPNSSTTSDRTTGSFIPTQDDDDDEQSRTLVTINRHLPINTKTYPSTPNPKTSRRVLCCCWNPLRRRRAARSPRPSA
ncbi:hypothetical protein M409DRAFT_56244 [Zasmidium cellare ATCC 36951]|uniref:Uncharacterized protein n=1 Tax=Zasmidium cellare ATCC 36951 TaxID=1080233 RepID=A0A6A6CHJ5_ZASCE|nr:uncharacterized protein M409DRAFT_56244 [Zasmidium cellare ATCC 36951]KAF2164886.1 hypothetical protein M409DRAFT_56244 [Zasmidium cellare ATCC 36951]